jgi:Protein of unknown function (DUF3616)
MPRRNWMLSGAVVAAIGVFSTVSLAASLSFTDVKVKPKLTTDKGKKESTNISGVSCLVPDDGRRTCLVIDDEGRLAQAATLEDERLRGAGKIRIIGDAAPDDIVGSAPDSVNCSKGGNEFKDLDGEAVAFDGKNFYVSGSHGCTRHHNKFTPSSFVLARVPKALVTRALTEPGPIEDASIQTTYRLSEALRMAAPAGDFFAQDLLKTHKINGNKAGGLNIEGLLVADGKLYAGLRGPVVDGRAYVIETPVEPLFKAGQPLTGVVPHTLDLDDGRGIRDLASMPDGRILVLGGPSQDEDVDFALYAVKPTSERVWKPERIGVLHDLPSSTSGTKAEAAFVLGQDGSGLQVLVMFDGPEQGGPRIYTVK